MSSRLFHGIVVDGRAYIFLPHVDDILTLPGMYSDGEARWIVHRQWRRWDDAVPK